MHYLGRVGVCVCVWLVVWFLKKVSDNERVHVTCLFPIDFLSE